MILTNEQMEALDTALEIVRMCCSEKCYEALKSIKTQHDKETQASEPDKDTP